MLENIVFVTIACLVDIFTAKYFGRGFHTWSLGWQFWFVLCAIAALGIMIGFYCALRDKELNVSATIMIVLPMMAIGLPFFTIWGLSYGQDGVAAASVATLMGPIVLWVCVYLTGLVAAAISALSALQNLNQLIRNVPLMRK